MFTVIVLETMYQYFLSLLSFLDWFQFFLKFTGLFFYLTL